jgi:hypothetical protein
MQIIFYVVIPAAITVYFVSFAAVNVMRNKANRKRRVPGKARGIEGHESLFI